jgi:lipid A ethanolaminephosphotransferase
MPTNIKSARLLARLAQRPSLSVATLVTLWSVATVLLYNGPFWSKTIEFLAPVAVGQWLALVAFGAALAALQLLLFLPLATRKTVRWLLIALTLVATSTHYFSATMGTYFDVPMITNLLETDLHESSQLLTRGLLVNLFIYGVLPSLLIWRCQIVTGNNEWRRRLLAALLALLVVVVGLLASFQSFSPLMRNHKELRYLIAPGNALVALPRALGDQAGKISQQRLPIGEDSRQRPSPIGDKPLLLVLVVGETQRAANWQLNGYGRATTPKLAARDDLVSFDQVSSCGTSTAVSLPCMFSRQTKAQYDASSARGEQTLADVVAKAGIGVEWIDNQSGCKGICSEVETDRIAKIRYPDLCSGGECYDQVLVRDLAEELAEESHRGDQLLILHMMGSHGPAYYARYPEQMAPFIPDCRQKELSQCTQQEIINAYDNSIAYSDQVLSQLLEQLSRDSQHHTALIYLSDHGESLGEMGLYLHGLPYFIAPNEQTKVPMFWWFSPGYLASQKLDRDCLRAAAQFPTSHDSLFHSVLNLLNVETALYQAQLDPGAGCRRP